MRRTSPAASLLTLAVASACHDAPLAPAASRPGGPSLNAAADSALGPITVLDLAALGVPGAAVDVNSRGQVVGGCGDRANMRNPMSESDYLMRRADDGIWAIVGASDGRVAQGRAFLWSAADGVRDLGTLGGARSCAAAINDAGQVVGYSETSTGAIHAFIWTAAGGMRDLGTLAGHVQSRALDINEAGVIAGWSTTGAPYGRGRQAVRWTADGTIESLGAPATPPSFSSAASSVNDAGEITGYVHTTESTDMPGFTAPRAFRWTAATGMRRIHLGGGSSTRWYPRAISDRGWMVGSLNAYGDIGGLVTDATDQLPTFIDATPSSHPLMTRPVPIGNSNGSPRSTELSNFAPLAPFSHSQPV